MNIIGRVIAGYARLIKNSTALLSIVLITLVSSVIVVAPIWYVATHYPTIFNRLVLWGAGILICSLVVRTLVVRIRTKRAKKLAWTGAKVLLVVGSILLLLAAAIYQYLWLTVVAIMASVVTIGLVLSGN